MSYSSAEAEQKRIQRREKRLAREKLADGVAAPSKLFLQRPWISLPLPPNPNPGRNVKIMTWNLLAQCLVRSELFPTSGKARKASGRVPMLHAEILSHDADILCMQEVDGLEKLLPLLDLAGYAYSYASGPHKPHGCLIAYKSAFFRGIHETKIEYDILEVHSDPRLSTQTRIGSSHQTRNIANIVALQRIGPEPDVQGYVIATTHLFWHPAYTYERARQAALLVREVAALREVWQLHDWSCIIAGDFNFPPDDPAYSLLVGEPLSVAQQERLQVSRVVHVSIDPTVHTATTEEQDDEEGGEEKADPDRVIRNSRNPNPSDGLLSDAELFTLAGHRLRSAYDEGQRASLLEQNDVATYGARNNFPQAKAGACNDLQRLMWIPAVAHKESDYIFILDAPGSKICVTGYLQPHRTEDVTQGLPQIGICGSDHFSLCAQLVHCNDDGIYAV